MVSFSAHRSDGQKLARLFLLYQVNFVRANGAERKAEAGTQPISNYGSCERNAKKDSNIAPGVGMISEMTEMGGIIR